MRAAIHTALFLWLFLVLLVCCLQAQQFPARVEVPLAPAAVVTSVAAAARKTFGQDVQGPAAHELNARDRVLDLRIALRLVLAAS